MASRLCQLSIVVLVSLAAQPCGAFTPYDQGHLKAAVEAWNTDYGAAWGAYGPVSTWVITAVTNFGDRDDVEGLFKNLASFNKDLTGWDTSSVTTMYCTFQGTSSFNKPLGFDTGRCCE